VHLVENQPVTPEKAEEGLEKAAGLYLCSEILTQSLAICIRLANAIAPRTPEMEVLDFASLRAGRTM